MARTIIGLDLGWSAIKAVVITAHFNRRELTSQHLIPLPAVTTQEELENAWKAGLAQLKEEVQPPQGTTIVATFPGGGLNSHILDLPFKENKKIDTTLNGELDFQQTIVDVDDLAASWTHGKARNNNNEGPYPVIVSTVKQERLVKLLALLKECGFEPQMVLHPAASWPLTRLTGRKEAAAATTEPAEVATPAEEQLEMVVDIGAARTNVAIFTGTGELLLVRTMAFGAGAADQNIADALEIPLADATALRETEGTLIGAPISDEQQKLQDIITDHYRLLASQLRLTINRLPQVNSNLTLSLVGGASRQKGITQFLQDELGLPTRRLTASDLLANHFAGADQLSVDVLGAACCALAALGNHHGGLLDFRRGQFAYQGELSWIKGQAIRLVVGFAAVFAFALLSLIIQLNIYSKAEAQLDKQFCKITKQTVKQEICEPRAALSALSNPTGPQGTTLPTYSATDQFVALSKGVPEDLQVVFSDLNISPDRIIIKGTCADFETLDKLVLALSKMPCVTEAKQTRSSKAKEEVEYSITMKYECQPGMSPLSEAN